MNRYPTYMLTNGNMVEFQCYNIEGLEQYAVVASDSKLIRDSNGSWSIAEPKEWGKRLTPLFGVTIAFEI